LIVLFPPAYLVIMSSAYTPPTDLSSHTWLTGSLVFLALMWAIAPFTVVAWTSQHTPRPGTHDIELAELPRFVDPDLVRDRLLMPTPVHIDLPPPAHLRP
jgi:hypothetical protein